MLPWNRQIGKPMLSLLFTDPLLGFLWIVAVLVTLTVHEFSHALAAVALGDRTPEQQGRLSLNPLHHLDPWGALLMVTVGFGWAKPVPFNPYNLRARRWGPALVALAGPTANLVCVLVFGSINLLIGSSLGPDNLLSYFLAFLVLGSTSIFLFNLIPLPPLDGSHVLLAFLEHPRFARTRFLLVTQGPMVLFALILLDSFAGISIFGRLFSGILGFVGRFFGIPW